MLFVMVNSLLFSQIIKAQIITDLPISEQKKINKHHPLPSNFIERGDTSITIFDGVYEKYEVYFINSFSCFKPIESYPTGIIIDGREYNFYCDSKRETKNNNSNFIDIYEFEYLNRKYVTFISFKENDLTNHCYNLFDITDKENVIATSYSKKVKQTDVWEELEAFHQSIALTFHPAEDGDFEPVKNDSDELVEAAQKLSTSKLPAFFEKIENKELKTELQMTFQKLVKQSKELHNLVEEKKSTNKELLVKLHNLHSTYHHIEELNNQAQKN